MQVKIQGDPVYRVFLLGLSEASDSMSTPPTCMSLDLLSKQARTRTSALP